MFSNSGHRLSFDDSYSQSQRRFSTGGDERPSQRQSQSGKVYPLEPPCLPAMVRTLYNSRDEKTGVVKPYSLAEIGPIALVGWPRTSGARITPGESQFKFADGTGSVLVRMGISSDKETMLIAKLRHLVLGEEKKDLTNTADENEEASNEGNEENDENVAPKVAPMKLNYLRVVGTVAQDLDDGNLVIMAIHVREAHPEEAAFHHHLECASIALKHSPHVQAAAKIDQTFPLGEVNKKKLDHVELPSNCTSISDPFQVAMVRVLVLHRKPEVGMTIEQLEAELCCMGFGDAGEFTKAFDELKEADFLVPTIEGFVDLV